MDPTFDIEIIVKRFNPRREDEIIDAIEATEGFSAALDYEYGHVSAGYQAMPDYEIESSMEKLIRTIRAANGTYCKVGVILSECSPPTNYKHRRRRFSGHKRRRLKIAA